MAYYDALIEKWPSLGAPAVSKKIIGAAVSVFNAGEPAEVPQPPDKDAAQKVWDAYHGARSAALDVIQAWHETWTPMFCDDGVLAKLETLNAQGSPGPSRLVPIDEAVGWLREQRAWMPIKTSTSEAALSVMDLYEDPRAQALDFDLPLVQAVLQGLVAEKLLTDEQAAGLLALGHTSIPWWSAAGYSSPISPTDLEAVFAQSGGKTVLV